MILGNNLLILKTFINASTFISVLIKVSRVNKMLLKSVYKAFI